MPFSRKDVRAPLALQFACHATHSTHIHRLPRLRAYVAYGRTALPAHPYLLAFFSVHTTRPTTTNPHPHISERCSRVDWRAGVVRGSAFAHSPMAFIAAMLPYPFVNNSNRTDDALLGAWWFGW